eukprot:3178692-Alexandrium_andersonii.AAC.1
MPCRAMPSKSFRADGATFHQRERTGMDSLVVNSNLMMHRDTLATPFSTHATWFPLHEPSQCQVNVLDRQLPFRMRTASR